MKKILFLSILLLIYCTTKGQELTQTIRGTVTDKQSGTALIGANVIVLNTAVLQGTVTDINGNFRLENVAVGRQDFQISFIGYEAVTLSGIVVSSGKELILNVELDEKVLTTEEVIVLAQKKGETVNEMTLLSARSFSVEETERYAGSMGDPSRMASNFAGVMSAGDQVNDIIIRGNSPNGLLWRLEGINIPNPNHFGALGSTGGPVSMLNNNTLSNSDFLTGAFPAEYGNALSGSFDLQMRSGNNEKREYLFQVGFNGFEVGLEGPFTTNSRASYMANYRYSTMGVFDKLGVDIGVGAVPFYQDATFMIDVPISPKSKISVFGLGGLSKIQFTINEGDTITGGTDFTSDMGVVGLSYVYYFNPQEINSARLQTTVALSGTRSTSKDSIMKYNEIQHVYGDKSTEIKMSFTSELTKKFNSKNSFKIGVIYDVMQLKLGDSIITDKEMFFNKLTRIDDNLALFQAYTQLQHKISDNLKFNIGVHYQIASLNSNYTIEPRLGMEWKINEKQTFTIGYGLHSQLQPKQIYFLNSLLNEENQIYTQTNKKLDFSKSHHFVSGFQHQFTQDFRLKVEAYYQQLYNIPVEKTESWFSLINYGTSYTRITADSLVNEGTGTNYGLDFTLEKFLSNNYYFLATFSLFESKYCGSDGVERNTLFNGNFVAHALGGYEFIIKEKNALSIDLKATTAGGVRYIPIDLEQSRIEDEQVFNYEEAFKNRRDNYVRFDLRISFKQNKPKFTQEWAVELQNFTNQNNFFMEYYDRNTQNIENVSQMGFFPMGLYRITF